MADEKTTTEQPETENADGGGDGQEQAAPITFTQDQLDAILKDRLERANTKAQADLLAELGIEDTATAKKTLAEAKATQAAQMSELEKAQAQIADLEAQSVQAKTEAEAIQTAADEALLKAAIISQAGAFNDPEDAWLFVDRSTIKITDGSYGGVEEALKALAETKPYLVKAENGTGPGTPARAKQKTIVEKIFEKNQQPSGEQPRRSTVKF